MVTYRRLVVWRVASVVVWLAGGEEEKEGGAGWLLSAKTETNISIKKKENPTLNPSRPIGSPHLLQPCSARSSLPTPALAFDYHS